MSNRYIIEIEEEPLVRKSDLHGEDAVYRASGFKSLVFDQSGLNTLIPANTVLTCGDADRLESEGYKRGYQNGLKKAWEAAQWICQCVDIPLIEVPNKHGDLIDRDALKQEMLNGIKAGNLEEGYEMYANINTVDDCVECVRWADAVIEAEDEI